MIAAATVDMVKDAHTLTDEAQQRLNNYLNGFLEPVYKHDKDGEPNAIICPRCRSLIYSGGIMDALMSAFQWGIAHGDGFCGKCKWPIRMYHFIKLDGDNKQQLTFPLAYRCYEDDDCTIEVDPANYETNEDGWDE